MPDVPLKYRKIPRVVEAMLIIDYTSMKKAADWINSTGGFARITNMKEHGAERLMVETTLGLVEIPRQYFLIQGDLGGFYSYPRETFNVEYELLGDSE